MSSLGTIFGSIIVKKANGAVNALFSFPQRSQTKETTLQAESTQIFHYLQTLLTRASLAELSLFHFSCPKLASSLLFLY